MVAASIALTPTRRPGGLQTAARPVEGPWERGLYVGINSVSAPHRLEPCPVDPTTPEPGKDVAEFVPVTLRTDVACSTLGRPDVEGYAAEGADATGWFGLSQELWDGAATSNPSLADAISAGTAETVTDAIGVLEGLLDTYLSGRLGVLHVPVGLSIHLRNVRAGDDGVLRTLAGNRVAIHGTGTRIVGTGEVWAALGLIDSRDWVDRRDNTAEGWADLAGIAVFDPSVNVAVTVTPVQAT